ncbi:hypothetical protein FCV25MIE_00593 [Fagus crenata]
MAVMENRLPPMNGERNQLEQIRYHRATCAYPLFSSFIFFIVVLDLLCGRSNNSMPDYPMTDVVTNIILFVVSFLMIVISFLNCYREIKKNAKVVPLEAEQPAPMV